MRSLLILLFGILVASCGLQISAFRTPGPGQLSQAEFLQIQSAVFNSLQTLGAGSFSAARFVVFDVIITADGTYDCPEGGTVTGNGGTITCTNDGSPCTGDTIVITVIDCTYGGGLVLNGSMTMSDASFTGTETLFDYHLAGSITGTRNEEILDACAVDVDGTGDAGADELTVDGLICGEAVSETVSYVF